jgi:hypothetical protein
MEKGRHFQAMMLNSSVSSVYTLTGLLAAANDLQR